MPKEMNSNSEPMHDWCDQEVPMTCRWCLLWAVARAAEPFSLLSARAPGVAEQTNLTHALVELNRPTNQVGDDTNKGGSK